MSAILTFDIGGTRIKAGLVRDAAASSSIAEPTVDREGIDGVLATVRRLGRRLMAGADVDAVGLCIRGVIDPERGVIRNLVGPLVDLVGEPLADQVARELGRPTCMENDARMYALGEWAHGAGRGSRNMVCLTLGTGIGSGVVMGGRVLRGPRGVAGILAGHLTVQVDGPRCICGNLGCLEALIGTGGLIRAAGLALATGRPSALRDGPLDPARIFAAAATGDAPAREVVGDFARRLGAGVVTMIHAYDPDVVVLGGGMTRAAPQFLPAVQAYVDAHAWTTPPGRVRVVPAALGDAAALVGVAELARGTALLS